MAQRKDDTPSVATYADHEVITPPHELRKVIAPAARRRRRSGRARRSGAGRAVVRIRRMDAIRMRAPRNGAPGRQARRASPRQTHEVLFRVAHDIKGEAATFGYPAVGRRRRKPVPAARAHPGDRPYSDRACRSARRRRARHHPRICPSRSRRHRRRADAAPARCHRRVPQAGKQLSTGLSGKHFLAAARSRRCRH